MPLILRGWLFHSNSFDIVYTRSSLPSSPSHAYTQDVDVYTPLLQPLLQRSSHTLPHPCKLYHQHPLLPLPPHNREPPPDIPKEDAAAKEHARDPRGHADALVPHQPGHEVRAGAAVCSAGALDGRRGDPVGIYGEEGGGAGEADGAGEEEAGARAVDEIPDDGVDEGEGEGDLKGGLPGEAALWMAHSLSDFCVLGRHLVGGLGWWG